MKAYLLSWLRNGCFDVGACIFALELSTNGNNNTKPAPLSVLTARARELKFALALKPKDKLCSAYRAIGEQFGHKDWGVDTDGGVYYGSVMEWIITERKGIRKFKNFGKIIDFIVLQTAYSESMFLILTTHNQHISHTIFPSQLQVFNIYLFFSLQQSYNITHHSLSS